MAVWLRIARLICLSARGGRRVAVSSRSARRWGPGRSGWRPDGAGARAGILGSVAEHSTPETIRTLLTDTRTWAVVGCSPDPRRDSHRIARLLQTRGFRVVPVNPHVDEVLGERAYPSLAALPDTERVDVVDIFRRADQAGAHVEEAIAAGVRGVWMQLGVIDEAAAQRALEAGLLVVMNRCPAIELPRLAAA